MVPDGHSRFVEFCDAGLRLAAMFFLVCIAIAVLPVQHRSFLNSGIIVSAGK